MSIVRRHQTNGKKVNRKEILLTREEKQMLKIAMKIFAADESTTIRLLIRDSIIRMAANQKLNGYPILKQETKVLLDNLLTV